ncbi:MAG: hypothetical protein GWO24_10250, partial [Akkermansiaceae bacterium]|nr:hypothetical protein [Akkermansiaceae bacterium]
YPNPEVDLSVGIPFVNMADTWKYNDTGANLGTAWKEPGYNDNGAGWKSGPGLFGYETSSIPAPGIQTQFTNPRDNNPYIITYYYRKEFDYNGPL